MIVKDKEFNVIISEYQYFGQQGVSVETYCEASLKNYKSIGLALAIDILPMK